MNGTAGPGEQRRLGRFGASLLLLVPLLAVTAASGPNSAEARPQAADSAATRIVYAGTGHRSLGKVIDPKLSDPLFGTGPQHYDVEPSALGDTMVFASRRDEKNPQIYLRAADGSVRKLTSGRDAAHPRLTPDGSSVVFDSAEPGGTNGKKQRDLWLVHTDGTGLTRLTDTPYDEEDPTVSPDGTRIAYSSNSNAVLGFQIYERPLAGGTETRVTSVVGTATEPVWNPVNDAAHRDLIAYTYTSDSATGPRLHLVGGAGGDQQMLSGTPVNWRTHGAAWMPDGEGVLFLSPDRTCGCEGDWDHVYQVQNRTTAPNLVLQEDRAVGQPTWFGPQNGGYVVVDRTTAKGTNTADGVHGPHVVTLQDVRSDGADPRDLGVTILNEDPAADSNTDPAKDPLFNPAAGYDPWDERQTYTPDGRRIVVTRFTGDANNRIEQIYTVDADGNNLQVMPLAGRGPKDWDTDPTLSPDGKYLAFTRTSPGGVGPAAGPSRVLVADATTGAIVHEIVPPSRAADGRRRPAHLVIGRHPAGVHPEHDHRRGRRQQTHLDRAGRRPELSSGI
ncbi:TolB family protein [Streptomyces lasalocidi]